MVSGESLAGRETSIGFWVDLYSRCDPSTLNHPELPTIIRKGAAHRIVTGASQGTSDEDDKQPVTKEGTFISNIH